MFHSVGCYNSGNITNLEMGRNPLLLLSALGDCVSQEVVHHIPHCNYRGHHVAPQGEYCSCREGD